MSHCYRLYIVRDDWCNDVIEYLEASPKRIEPEHGHHRGEGGDREHLVKSADTAMYAAKINGKNQYQYFQDDMGDDSLKRITIAHHLQTMVKGESFEEECSIVYQPIIEQTEENQFNIVGAEALLRWANPELGSVTPETFIPIAEETNLISPMGEWVFYKSCQDVAPIINQLQSDFYISINFVSPPASFR